MMELLGQYALRLISGALICSIVLSLIPNNHHRPLIRVLCGIFLMTLLMLPLLGARWKLDLSSFQDAVLSGEHQAAVGEEIAREAQIQRITEAVESYILDKASLEGAVLTVNVTLGEDLLPAGAVLEGKLKSETRQSLSEMLEKELGIAKGNQRWIG